MSKVTVFIASSLDGYIARPDGRVDWLFTDEDYGYADFYASVDTLVMGYRTYEQILTFGDWPYPGKAAYVLSRFHSREAAGPVQFVRELPDVGENVWLVGGAQAIQAYADAGRIDKWIISIHPILRAAASRCSRAGRSSRY